MDCLGVYIGLFVFYTEGVKLLFLFYSKEKKP